MSAEIGITRAERKRRAWRDDETCPLCQLLITPEQIDDGTLISYNAEKPDHLRIAHGICADYWIQTGRRPPPAS